MKNVLVYSFAFEWVPNDNDTVVIAKLLDCDDKTSFPTPNSKKTRNGIEKWWGTVADDHVREQ